MKELVFKDFKSMVFDKEEIEKRVSKSAYKKYLTLLETKGSLDKETADEIAKAMKEWALEKGCTHFTHWFHPLTGATAEKHEAFLDKDGSDSAIIKFNGKTLIKGEPDASSFPSGGLRSTFEARGYTYWDISSPAFIRDNVLCIPSVFVSYHGESLDKKGPLLKSMSLISDSATRLLNLIGYKDVTSCKPMVGLEQEYFLIDRDVYKKRIDLMLCGRTLFGHSAPKGQEFEDHYFGAIPTRVHAYMKEVDEELWKLGIYAKTEHNEVAPRQFELAPLYADANVAVDQNQIIMDMLKRVAHKHNFACLLHEKPFDGINGSGKHNNYSLVTNTGLNLFDSEDKKVFSLFVACFVKAVDKYPELLRVSAANPGNDFRLGCNEAPPAIISVFLGDYFENLIKEYADGKKTKETKTAKIEGFGYLETDNTDRNRTSPIAFTGNKFEFRMLGSSVSAAFPNVVLNTIMTEVMDEVYKKLEKTPKKDLEKAIKSFVSKTMKDHQRIIYGKNGYSDVWIKEAKKRGLPNIDSSIKAVTLFDSEKNIKLFTSHDIYSEDEILARKTILTEQYISSIQLEVKTMLSMVDGYVIPSIVKEIKDYTSISEVSSFAKKNVELLSLKLDALTDSLEELRAAFAETNKVKDELKRALAIRKKLVPQIQKVRDIVDSYEKISSKVDYALPTYQDMLY